MPPRRERRARTRRRQAPPGPHALTLEAMPPAVIEAIAAQMVPDSYNVLDDPFTLAQDAVAFSCVSKAWQRLALDVFRPRLEALYRPRPPAGQPEGAEPAAPSFRDDVLGGCKLWRIPAQGPPVPKLPPPCIPSGELWAEARYLRERGVATPHAKDLYGLTDKDLKGVHRHFKGRGLYGVAYAYRLSSLARAARRKFGSPAALQAFRSRRAAASAARRAHRAEEEEVRRGQLAAALAAQGVTLTPQLEEHAPVHRWLAQRGGSLRGAVEDAATAAFLLAHTDYQLHCGNYLGRKEDYRAGHWWALHDNYKLSERERADMEGLVLREWARQHGGAEAALAGVEVPACVAARVRAAMGRDWSGSNVRSSEFWDEDEENQLAAAQAAAQAAQAVETPAPQATAPQ